MPLTPGTSRPTFSRNVSEMVHAGHPLDQALAASYREQRASAHADGGSAFAEASADRQVAGFALGGPPAPWQVRNEARSMMHTGPIMSAVPGRTDRHNMSVASGSYVVPAQAVSHLGQSNTIAGMKVLNSMFGNAGPYGAGSMKVAHGAGAPRAPKPMKIGRAHV